MSEEEEVVVELKQKPKPTRKEVVRAESGKKGDDSEDEAEMGPLSRFVEFTAIAHLLPKLLLLGFKDDEKSLRVLESIDVNFECGGIIIYIYIYIYIILLYISCLVYVMSSVSIHVILAIDTYDL